MEQTELLPHLFRTEYRKITAVLSKLFGLEHIEIAQDIASDTFLLASESWGHKGLPENPVAWLYTVAKNKAKDYLRRDKLFNQKIINQIENLHPDGEEINIDLSEQNIVDSQLQMMFAVCHPSIPAEAQIGLSLHILCGFGIGEIATAFLTNKETINKRLFRAKEKMRQNDVKIEFPGESEVDKRLETVLTTLYLLYNEGYYAASRDVTLRKDVCLEAMRLTYLLLENKKTNQPAVNALLSLMCFQSSRFEARTDADGETVLYQDQNEALWDEELIKTGEYFLNQASVGSKLSKYHLEAGIAYWHTIKTDTPEKWQHILQFYNELLLIEYSPIAALNRTYALSKARGKQIAITEAEKLDLSDNHLYHSLLGELYTDVDNIKAESHFRTSLSLAKSRADQQIISKKIARLAVV
ncbi:RNA polymerase sigma factor [Dyadobacter pollutisoli]|uniref:Sigma-70 family RNA polymerase sigma factor n=1 Tax=Dyadobacter pollutisoli TaxID=2910158 RepID=A0A9E8NEH3_9BACT|nr:sigma-70 family RNA polymerase sigma factor [Dyadobacter pollutisoli]WAC15274.1 sigma-70 family RNA polymerase sigma factor [Dyadobacter pollutisoli]